MNDMPMEYQAQLAESQRRQAIAQAMAQQFMQGQQTQFVPGGTGVPIAVKQGGLGALAQALSGVISNQQAQQFGAESSAIQARNAAEQQQEYQDFVSNPDKAAAIAKALASRRAGVQKFGLEQQKREQERAKDYAGVVAPYDAGAAAGVISSGQIPGTPFQVPKLADPELKTTGGVSYLLTPEHNNKSKTSLYRPPSVNTNTVSVGGEKYVSEAEKALGKKVPELVERYQTEAKDATELIDKTQRLIELVQDPATLTGFAANPALFLSSIGAKLGFNGPDAAAKTQELLSVIASRTLAASAALKGSITEREWPRLEQAGAGALNYTPEAMLAVAKAAFVLNHNRLLQARKGYRGIVEQEEIGPRLAQHYPLPRVQYKLPGAETEFEELPDGTLKYKGTAPLSTGATPAPKKEKIYTLEELQKLIGSQSGGR